MIRFCFVTVGENQRITALLSKGKKKTDSLAKTKQKNILKTFTMAIFSSPSNLALGKRWYPTHQQVETDDHAAHDPEALGIIRAVESEQDREDDAAEIAHGANCTTEDTVGVRVDVRDEGEVGAVNLVLARMDFGENKGE